MMERFILNNLIAGKTSVSWKPLILRGCAPMRKELDSPEIRQRDFAHTACFNLERQNRLDEVFSGELAPERILCLNSAAHQKMEPIWGSAAPLTFSQSEVARRQKSNSLVNGEPSGLSGKSDPHSKSARQKFFWKFFDFF